MKQLFRCVATSTLATGFLAVALVDAFGAHACPHHDPLAAAADHAQSVPDGHSEHAHSAQAASHEDGSHDEPCTCVGECSGSAESDATSTSPQPRWGLDLAQPAVLSRTYDYLPTVRSAYLLPLANAPPV